MRFRMVLAYDGTAFAGWQVQPGQRTIQGTLEQALTTVLGETVRVEAAGRTDAGVHARGQVAAFSTERPVDLRALQKSLNALAAPDVSVLVLERAAEGFDPRRDAARRSYEYRIRNHPWASPFTRRVAWHVHRPLDVDEMRRAAAILVGEHDFSSFQAADCDAENPVRRVERSEIVSAPDDELHYRVTATAFLRHMVRAIVGTLVEVGLGERTVEEFSRVLVARERRLAGPTAPAHGLALVRIEYD